MRAVIFDLWDTVAMWPLAEWGPVTEETRQQLGLDADGFDRLWRETAQRRNTGPLRTALEELGLGGEGLERLIDVRRDFTRRALVPVDGAVDTLHELKRRGLRLGLISVCTDEVVELWETTAFHRLFDDAVFSCEVGLSKPDPRIYHLACERLGVEPAQAMFVGDGANDELAGAAAVGMTAVLVLPPERDEPRWEEARGWQPRVETVSDVLDLVDERSNGT
ncbi:MAG TPA: HAD family hydrolase [Gaiellaceae bacterium]